MHLGEPGVDQLLRHQRLRDQHNRPEPCLPLLVKKTLKQSGAMP
jgi:hypothetical protein